MSRVRGSPLGECDPREEMVRLAEQLSASAEIVNESEALAQLGGVGCLLRHRLPGG